MKKTIKSRIALACFVLAFIPMAAFSQEKAKPWPVPAEFKSKANPIKSSAASIADGKQLYLDKCANCHGKTGVGDGPKAKTLDTPSGDFTKASFQAETDGELFWKTKTGREDMPSYKAKMGDEDIWATVNYVRTLKK
jgi:mono/diheme cytochrome c family protein